MDTRMPWVRLILGAIAVEIAAIVALVLVVAVFGPNNAEAAHAYAEKMGFWVGPIAGAVFTLMGGYVISRRLPSQRIRCGALLGICVAGVDVAILLALQTPFEWIFLISDVTKLTAGFLGGVWAARSEA